MGPERAAGTAGTTAMPADDESLAVDAVLVESVACHLCDDAARVLGDAERDGRLRVRRVALDSEEGRAIARATRAPMPPIVLVGGELLGWGRLSRGRLRRRLSEIEAGA